MLALSDAYWQYRDGENALNSKQKYDRTYGMYPIVLNDSYKFSDFRSVEYTGGWGVGISKNCKDPVAAISF